MNNYQKLIRLLDNRIEHASSNETQACYELVKHFFTQHFTDNSSKKCVITNGDNSWELNVDGVSINFTGSDNAEYFRRHYSDMGYDVKFKDIF